jgi:hypothetical protein
MTLSPAFVGFQFIQTSFLLTFLMGGPTISAQHLLVHGSWVGSLWYFSSMVHWSMGYFERVCSNVYRAGGGCVWSDHRSKPMRSPRCGIYLTHDATTSFFCCLDQAILCRKHTACHEPDDQSAIASVLPAWSSSFCG